MERGRRRGQSRSGPALRPRHLRELRKRVEWNDADEGVRGHDRAGGSVTMRRRTPLWTSPVTGSVLCHEHAPARGSERGSCGNSPPTRGVREGGGGELTTPRRWPLGETVTGT